MPAIEGSSRFFQKLAALATADHGIKSTESLLPALISGLEIKNI